MSKKENKPIRATDLTNVPDLEAYHDRDVIPGKQAKLIEELEHQLKALQIEKTQGRNPSVIDREIERVEKEIKKYQHVAELQNPPEQTTQ
jgi:hypothetical protein